MKKIVLFVSAFFLSMINPVFAETILLRSGEKIEGKVVEKNKDYMGVVSEGSSDKQIYFNSEIDYIDINEDNVEAAIDPDKMANFYASRGMNLLSHQRLKWAEFNFQKALESAPSFFKAYQGLGLVNLKASNYEQALINFKKASEIDPLDPRPYCGIGSCYNELKRPADAISFLEKAIELDDSYAEAYFQMGKAHYDLDEKTEAEKFLLQSKKLFEAAKAAPGLMQDRAEQIEQLLKNVSGDSSGQPVNIEPKD
jgi:tetratricopeptide (TPR) repeat protein